MSAGSEKWMGAMHEEIESLEKNILGRLFDCPVVKI
jgi:hypothetical protein